MEIHFSIDGEECEGRVAPIFRPSLDRGHKSLAIHNGEQAKHEPDSSFPSNSGLQSTVSLTGIGYGGSTTHGDIVPRRGPDKGGLEAD